jgi:hypothetical protein
MRNIEFRNFQNRTALIEDYKKSLRESGKAVTKLSYVEKYTETQWGEILEEERAELARLRLSLNDPYPTEDDRQHDHLLFTSKDIEKKERLVRAVEAIVMSYGHLQ